MRTLIVLICLVLWSFRFLQSSLSHLFHFFMLPACVNPSVSNPHSVRLTETSMFICPILCLASNSGCLPLSSIPGFPSVICFCFLSIHKAFHYPLFSPKSIFHALCPRPASSSYSHFFAQDIATFWQLSALPRGRKNKHESTCS